MKLFLERILKSNLFPTVILVMMLISSCATKHAQYGKNFDNQITIQIADTATQNADTSKITHTFFLIGDLGNSNEPKAIQTLDLLHQKIKKYNKNSTLLFLGDNLYPHGFPNKSDAKAYSDAETKLKNQLSITKKFKGKTIFIAGNHDWDNGLEGLERESKYITDYLKSKKAFLPQNSCGIEELQINETTNLIAIDSQWYLQDWDKFPAINDNCIIKTKEDFFIELERLLTLNKGKTVLLAMHHPLLSNGIHGGQFSVEKQLFPFENKIPLPVIGSIINFTRKTTGVYPQDIQNKNYTYFVKRIKTLLQVQKNVIVVSAHDHSLQYIENENINQIISGSGSKSEDAKAIFPNDFSYGGNGYAVLKVYKNGAAKVAFYGTENKNEKLLFEHTVLNSNEKYDKPLPTTFDKLTTSSIYPKNLTQKSGVYKFFFGKHYRDYYSMPIEAKTVKIEDLFGGLTPEREADEEGYKTKSLLLVDKSGKEYVFRALKKNAAGFLQSVAFKDQYIGKKIKNTYAEEFLYDFYTTAHPYTPFAISNLADQIGVANANPFLYYIPKQAGLGDFNFTFGDELYLVEERPTNTQKSLKNFGKPDAIIKTDELLKNLHKDEKYTIDQSAYIRARLFDMLIGDLDRSANNWRWGEYNMGDKILYKPIPLERDQAFTKYDGALLSLLMNIPKLRNMRTFKADMGNVKWLNGVAYAQDLALLKTAKENEWIKQAQFIQENLTEAEINAAFKNLPIAVQDKTIDEIKQKLIARKSQLLDVASEYYEVLQKTVVIVGTDKKDKFKITAKSKKSLEVAYYRIKEEGDELIYTKEIDASQTKNLWIYGLDGDDNFEIDDNLKTKINITVIGGLNNDYYKIAKQKNVKIYDFKSEENTFSVDSKIKIVLTDENKVNLYNYEKPKYNVFSGLPFVGYNPDDGVKVGIIANYFVYKFKQNPYSQRHTFIANYFFATNGFELLYRGDFPNSIGKWDFTLDAQVTGPNFSVNYFGYGNETVNDEDIYGMDYNRAKLRVLKVKPGIKQIGRNGSELNLSAGLDRMTVEETDNRYINSPNAVNPNVFETQQFAGATAKYSFDNYDMASYATMGFGFSVAGSWTINVNETKSNFPTLETKLNFNHKLDSKGKVIFATILKSKVLFNDNYEFYQGATLGGDYDLRGYRNERFLGSQSFYQSSDVRWTLGDIRKNLLPMTYGFLVGYDYGRVWLEGEASKKWHQSFGGGLWLNGLGVLTARLAYFKSLDDKGRLSFGIGFGF